MGVLMCQGSSWYKARETSNHGPISSARFTSTALSALSTQGASPTPQSFIGPGLSGDSHRKQVWGRVGKCPLASCGQG